MNKIKLTILAILLANTYLLTAQKRLKKKEDKSAVIGMCRIYEDSIRVRWAPNNERLWAMANKHGYVIQRYEWVKKGGNMVRVGKILLTSSPLKPLPLDAWQGVVKKQERTAIIAQAIYGESFIAKNKALSPVAKAINDSDERKQRFGFAMLTADQYYEGAKAAGLALTDNDIKPDRIYAYKIYCALPENSEIKADTAYIIADFKKQKPVTEVKEPKGMFGDKNIKLEWPNNNTPNYFSGYFVERSTDSLHYEILNKEPIVYFRTDDDNSKEEIVSHSDSLPRNNIKYYYRVRGLTPFGELSPPSKTISGMGKTNLGVLPSITLAGVKNDGTVIVNWDYPKAYNDSIKMFVIKRAKNVEMGQVTSDYVWKDAPNAARVHIDKNPIPLAYYQVVAIDKVGQEYPSIVAMVELPDSIPPMQPCDLKGKIDTTGIVHLNWSKNTEPDFAGYRVFRANVKNGHFVQITKKTNLTESFIDTVNVNTLTKYVYYKLVAIDRRANPSDFSDVLELRRPDKYPPTAPILNDYEIQNKRVVLKWVNSSSDDVDSTILYKRIKGQTNWAILRKFSKNIVTSCIDSIGIANTEYEYKIVAKDESGKISKDEKQYLNIRWRSINIPEAPKPILEKVKEKNELLLKWTNSPQTSGVKIYRKINNDKMFAIDYIKDGGNIFKDIDLKKGNTYSYRIKAVFADGKESLFSEEVHIKLEETK